MKFPNLTAEECQEIIKYIDDNDNKHPMALKYSLSYFNINKIIRVLKDYDSIEDKDKKIKEIREYNKKRGILITNGIIDHKVNYMRNRNYYTKYNKDRAIKKKNDKLKIETNTLKS